MCEKAVEECPYMLEDVPDHFNTQKMCNKAIEIDPFTLWHVPNNLKMQEMCTRAVEACLGLLGYVPDWFVTQQRLKLWYDNTYYCNNDKRIKWYGCYKKRKAKKAKIKEELLPIAWHPDRVVDWCMSED